MSMQSIPDHIRSGIPANTKARDSADKNSTFSVLDFARRINALLELLDSTADALAATWDTHSEAVALDAAESNRWTN